MKFDYTLTYEYYNSLQEIMQNNNRKYLLELNKDILMKLLDSLEIEYDVQNLYIINETLRKNVYDIKKLSLFFEIDKKNFEDLVDSHLLDKYNNIYNIYCDVNNTVYFLNENYLWSEGNYPSKKISIKKLIYE